MCQAKYDESWKYCVQHTKFNKKYILFNVFNYLANRLLSKWMRNTKTNVEKEITIISVNSANKLLEVSFAPEKQNRNKVSVSTENSGKVLSGCCWRKYQVCELDLKNFWKQSYVPLARLVAQETWTKTGKQLVKMQEKELVSRSEGVVFYVRPRLWSWNDFASLHCCWRCHCKDMINWVSICVETEKWTILSFFFFLHLRKQQFTFYLLFCAFKICNFCRMTVSLTYNIALCWVFTNNSCLLPWSPQNSALNLLILCRKRTQLLKY